MVDSDIEALTKRVTALEIGKKVEKIQKIKVPRKESEYNKFMKKYIADEKKKGTEKSHKDLFSAGAKAWSLAKV